MSRFVYLVHPFLDYDLKKRMPLIKNWPSGLIELGLKFVFPFKVSELICFKTVFGKAEGYFIFSPLPLKSKAEGQSAKKLVQAARLAEKLGADFIGLDFSLTRAIEQVAGSLQIPITVGKTYNLIAALSAVRQTAKTLNLNLNQAELLVAGATGDLGSALVQLLAEEVKYLTICSGETKKLERLAGFILERTGTAVKMSSNLNRSLSRADFVFIPPGTVEQINPLFFKAEAVVCDLNFPSTVSKEAASRRNDLLFIQGGAVQLPAGIGVGVPLDLPGGKCSPSLAQTIILALEKKWDYYVNEEEISLVKLGEIEQMGQKHGLKVDGFFSYQDYIALEN